MYLDLVVGCLSEVKRSLVLNSFNCYCFEKNIRYYNYGSLRLFWCNWRMKSHSATEKTSSWDVWRANGDGCWHHLIKATVTITHIIFTAMLAYDVSGKSASNQQAEGKPVTTEFSFAWRNKHWSLPALTVHFDFHVKDKLLICFPVAYGKKSKRKDKEDGEQCELFLTVYQGPTQPDLTQIYSQLYPKGHLDKTDTSLKWTPRDGPCRCQKSKLG